MNDLTQLKFKLPEGGFVDLDFVRMTIYRGMQERSRDLEEEIFLDDNTRIHTQGILFGLRLSLDCLRDCQAHNSITKMEKEG